MKWAIVHLPPPGCATDVRHSSCTLLTIWMCHLHPCNSIRLSPIHFLDIRQCTSPPVRSPIGEYPLNFRQYTLWIFANNWRKSYWWNSGIPDIDGCIGRQEWYASHCVKKKKKKQNSGRNYIDTLPLTSSRRRKRKPYQKMCIANERPLTEKMMNLLTWKTHWCMKEIFIYR
jgi:hypothetical protein